MQLPIKWKLTLWSSLLLFVLFVAYNAVQYVYVEHWMIKREKTSVQQTMRAALNYFLENEFAFKGADLAPIRSFLERINGQNQGIRVFDGSGNVIVSISNGLGGGWGETPERGIDNEIAGTWRQSDNLLMMKSPLTIFEFNGTIEIVRNTEDFAELIAAFSRVMLLCGLGALVLSGLGGWMLARQVLKPLQSMSDTIRNIKRKGLHERVPLSGNHDEIYTLMSMFNNMMDQVESSFLQQKQFVEDASHELRTPVAIIEGHLAMLRRWGKNDPAILEESLDASIHELFRFKGLVQELLALSRAEAAPPEDDWPPADPAETIWQIVRNSAVVHPSFRFDAETDALAGVAVGVPEHQLEQILHILIDNSVKYSRDLKAVHVTGTVQGDQVCIQVADQGMGIPASELPRVLDRFYRVDKARSGEQGGHGLGLAIAKRLVERYDGTIKIDSVEHGGTRVTVLLSAVPRINGK
ncbi:HAMP domain-containing sensor histidine kinase [Paenibacillus ginsengarvi]|uniref:HAMP domain-containing sensor histidine kinase n=1 Tax=Paenibacillus ginsengarvi TaxID=400777 RepID=UPI001F01D996|nr:HAMP domain-containing histidine kinase [Paenibacillus ginsengarvi]